ncbi:MAG: FIST N-terminal domain-containing protein [Gammaproteobacteria bacterium]|jgi:hypothetical protein
MPILFEPNGKLELFFKNIDQAINSGAKSLLLFSADENKFDTNKINSKLKSISIPVFGGIFPQIIYKNNAYKNGTIVCGLDFAVQTCSVTGLSDVDTNYKKQISSYLDKKIAEKLEDYATMMILVDGNSKYIARLIEKIYGFFGKDITYLGGGAGTLQLKPMPCLFTNQGLLADSAQLVLIDKKALISVAHGWEKLAGPFVITDSDHNVIKMIDYHPAFETYKKIIEDNSIYKFTKDNFFDVAKNYPFGIEKLDGSFIVRDPIIERDKTLICVAEVPENSIVYVLKSTEKKLIAAARKASTNISQKLQGSKQSHFTKQHLPIIFDCISRSLILKENFTKELNAINTNLPELIGASTIGEIANHGDFCLEFYNKTLVLALFMEN